MVPLSYCNSLQVELEFIDIAPAPRLTRLEGPHDGMPGLVKMLRRVPIFGGIATADVTAFQAEAEMDPLVS